MKSKYWQQRQRDTIYNQVLQVAETQLAKEYERCFNETYDKIEKLFNEIIASTGNETLLLSDLYKYNRYYELMNELNKGLTKLGQREIQITDENLKKMYLLNSQLITDELGKKYGSSLYVDENIMKKAINSVWCQDGQHWSGRIWKNKELLQEKVKKGMVDCVARGVSKNELINELSKQFNKDTKTGLYEASRIVRTELNYIQNQSTYDKYIQAGIEKYKFLAEVDNRTSDVCKEHNGKIYKLSEASVGENYPPLHPNCRSTVLAVL